MIKPPVTRSFIRNLFNNLEMLEWRCLDPSKMLGTIGYSSREKYKAMKYDSNKFNFEHSNYEY